MNNQMGTLLMIVLFVALGYIMLVRPAQVQRKKQAQLLTELQPGSRVQTQIGVYGTLVALGEVLAQVEVAPGVVITLDKRLVSGVVPRSRDEFWTYPDEPAEEATTDALEQDLVEQDVDRDGVDQDVVEGTVEPDRSADDVSQTGTDRTDKDDQADGPDDRKA